MIFYEDSTGLSGNGTDLTGSWSRLTQSTISVKSTTTTIPTNPRTWKNSLKPGNLAFSGERESGGARGKVLDKKLDPESNSSQEGDIGGTEFPIYSFHEEKGFAKVK